MHVVAIRAVATNTANRRRIAEPKGPGLFPSALAFCSMTGTRPIALTRTCVLALDACCIAHAIRPRSKGPSNPSSGLYSDSKPLLIRNLGAACRCNSRFARVSLIHGPDRYHLEQLSAWALSSDMKKCGLPSEVGGRNRHCDCSGVITERGRTSSESPDSHWSRGRDWRFLAESEALVRRS